jgi:hypothetical protein
VGAFGILWFLSLVVFAYLFRSFLMVLLRRVAPCTSLMCFGNVRWEVSMNVKSSKTDFPHPILSHLCSASGALNDRE